VRSGNTLVGPLHKHPAEGWLNAPASVSLFKVGMIPMQRSIHQAAGDESKVTSRRLDH